MSHAPHTVCREVGGVVHMSEGSFVFLGAGHLRKFINKFKLLIMFCVPNPSARWVLAWGMLWLKMSNRQEVRKIAFTRV